MKTIIFTIFFLSFIVPNLNAQGNVYLVLGSDTGIWDGLGVTTFHNTYGLELYTDPNENAYKVMADDFRNLITDSYGNKLKLTWWMMGGNTYRYGTNINVPINNIMPLYLMKKYHSEKIQKWGDEVSLHYHTFFWYDYDGDGKYYWNQAQRFEDSKEDFDYTLSQFLIEENVYPVSFRAGWHYMDNYWQNYLNELFPFSMHNDFPHVHLDTEEPIDNNYDWSQSSPEFVPFHPSVENYQLSGNGKGWDLRSVYMASMDSTLMDQIFDKAQNGTDQVVCLWAHLPQQDFLDNILRINNIVHKVESNHSVKFRYCTAVEAMQRWLKTSDTTKPAIQLTEQANGDYVKFLINTNEPIFQNQPFVAVKNLYNDYSIIQCDKIGENTWVTSTNFLKKDLVKVGAAVIDTVGNLTTAFIKYLPDDIFIDNEDPGYSELKGNWSTINDRYVWNLKFKKTNINNNDSAVVKWVPQISKSGDYNIFIQIPFSDNQADQVKFIINSGNQKKEKIMRSFNSQDWNFIANTHFNFGENNFIEMIAYGDGANNTITSDVIKISALIRNKYLNIPQKIIEFDPVAEEDTAEFKLIFENLGIDTLKISDMTSKENKIFFAGTFPIIIPGMQSDTVKIMFHSSEDGFYSDTLFVNSDDDNNPVYAIPFNAEVKPYFKIVDNEDSNYEETGSWSNSSAASISYKNSSRYAFLNQNPPAAAAFTSKISKNGIYNIEEFVPITVNAAKEALYILKIDNVKVDSSFVDQNEGSGDWKIIFKAFLPKDVLIEIEIMDSGENTPNVVLRADAVRFSIVKEVTEINKNKNTVYKFELDQNYPNPFNPSTFISYSLPKTEKVKLEIFNILGERISLLVDQVQQKGSYKVKFVPNNLSNGIYFYRLTSGKFSETKKMILLK